MLSRVIDLAEGLFSGMKLWTILVLALGGLSLAFSASHASAEENEDLAQVQLLAKQGKLDEALALTAKLVKKSPDDKTLWQIQGALHTKKGLHQEALEDAKEWIRLDPRNALAHEFRGSMNFMLGNIQASLDDFDREIELDRAREAGHWKRGISYYYAGKFAEGRKQFEGYQTVDDNDVENGVWQYLCGAKETTPAQARTNMLKIGRDGRVPLMEVYELFRQKSTPEKVMEHVTQGNPPPAELQQRSFYAHLYLGLYYDSEDDRKKSEEHIKKAIEQYKQGPYMWEVARIHLRHLQGTLKAEKKK